ncbi:hypothetical protein [Zunongwangia atlantica]|uniref:Uncharacterized protein n=1 Tax=Zunongwangia atlantica 22II14-10F7 TaxID=1185767 RepID=A0A1Y1SYR9_9FLAO|nr:hypothetical protein [Zunongwangia atlantica]ORL43890.1 hypothetical protein IIF7_18509 [Zunongwangia atlantica 22II14-10F7]
MKRDKNKKMDDEQYVILRKNGFNNQKAKIISQNKEYSKESNIKSYSDEGLKINARNLGITNYDKLDRDSLISAILERSNINS